MPRLRVIRATTALLLLALNSSPASQAEAAVPPAYQQVAALYEIPGALFYAVALAESGKRIESLEARRPWPWTLNIAGNGAYYETRWAAWQALDAALKTGETRIDIGLMQVNWRYHQRRLKTPWLALEPGHNLKVGAAILKGCYRERRDWWASVGCYHAPNDADRARQYRERVARAWRNVTAED